MIDQKINRKLRVSASLVAAPWSDLSRTLKELEISGVEMLHFDIEDGHFTPSISFGTRMLAELRSHSSLIFDVHLMVDNPEMYIDDLADAGAERISFHWEATRYPLRVLDMIKEKNIKAGLSFNPSTQIPDLTYLVPCLDYVNLLSTEPLEKSSNFIYATINKLTRGYNKYSEYKLEWMVDGGVRDQNILSIAGGHADVVVIGRYLFEGRIDENIKQIIGAVSENSF